MIRETIRKIDPLRGRPVDARIAPPGGVPRQSVTVTSTAYTVFDKTYIFVDDDTAGGVVTVTLPPAVDSRDQIKYVKKLGTTANVTIDGNGSETIDGTTTSSLTAQYQSTILVCDGTEWWSF